MPVLSVRPWETWGKAAELSRGTKLTLPGLSDSQVELELVSCSEWVSLASEILVCGRSWPTSCPLFCCHVSF